MDDSDYRMISSLGHLGRPRSPSQTPLKRNILFTLDGINSNAHVVIQAPKAL